MSDDEIDRSTPSPEYLALLEDLKAYDNPEVFLDETQAQFYYLQISTLHLPQGPSILALHVNGEALPDALRETALALIQLDPNFDSAQESIESL